MGRFAALNILKWGEKIYFFSRGAGPDIYVSLGVFMKTAMNEPAVQHVFDGLILSA
jgi:hypothetical protein